MAITKQESDLFQLNRLLEDFEQAEKELENYLVKGNKLSMYFEDNLHEHYVRVNEAEGRYLRALQKYLDTHGKKEEKPCYLRKGEKCFKIGDCVFKTENDECRFALESKENKANNKGDKRS